MNSGALDGTRGRTGWWGRCGGARRGALAATVDHEGREQPEEDDDDDEDDESDDDDEGGGGVRETKL